MVLGGMAITQASVSVFDNSIQKFRDENKMWAELKWRKISNGKLQEYKRFVDCFFALNNTNRSHFHALIIDTNQIDHARFGCDNETGFYKFYYQLLLHCFGKKYCVDNPDTKIMVRLDERNSHYSLGDLKNILNAGMRSKFSISTDPFRSVEPRDSHASNAIQMVDILIGAIGYKKNGFDLLSGASEARKEMAAYIQNHSGLDNFTLNTPLAVKRFNIWNFRPQK